MKLEISFTAALVAAAVGAGWGCREDSGREIARVQLSRIGEGLAAYRDRRGSFPETPPGLEALTSTDVPSTARLPRVPNDPWGRAYEYVRDLGGGGCVVRSLGEDGTPGTHDDILVRY